MTMTKDSNLSHVTDIGSTMLKFLNKEGSGSFPTIVVLLNRIFLSPDDFSWKENGEFSDDLPVLKEHDDLHWYKIFSGDLWNDNVRPSVSCTMFPNTKQFITEDIDEKYSVIKKVYKSNGHSFEVHFDGKLYSCDSIGENVTEVANATITRKIIDHIFASGCDFFLTADSIYRSVNKGDLEEVYTSNGHITLNSFCFCNNRIVVASSSGGLVFNNINTTFDQEESIKEYHVERQVIDSSTSDETTGGSSGDGSSTGGTVYKTVYDTNHLPQSNIFTNVYAIDETHISIGDSEFAGKFIPGNPSTYKETDEVDDLSDNSLCSIRFKKSPRHINLIPIIYPIDVPPKSENENDQPVEPKETVCKYDGVEYKDLTLSVNISGILKTEKITFVALTDGNIAIYKNSDNGETRYMTIDSSNGVPSGIVDFFEIGDSYYISTADKVYRSVTENDESNPTNFVLFGFHFKEDNKKDTIDARQTRLSFKSILSLGYDRETYNSLLGKANSVNTTFIVSWSKVNDKLVWNFYGNDERKNEAAELRDCCNAFDIGLPG